MPFWPTKNEDVVDNKPGTPDPKHKSQSTLDCLYFLSGAMCKPPFENRWLLRELCVLD
jgi:hypothetical protein